MAIRFTKYIDINSVVGAAAQVPQRLWVARVFTTNSLVGPNSILQFTSAGDVGTFFGTSSEEFARALAYFTFESPLGNAPVAIQFARYVEANQPALVFGEANAAVLATLQAITAGKLSLKFGANVVNITGINLGSAVTFADVATALQTAIRAGTGAPNGELTTATVTYNATAQAFDFSASPTVTATETFSVITPASGVTPTTDVAAALGWYVSQGALNNDAALLETAAACYTRVINLDNNFGEFCFTDVAALALSDVEAVAALNAEQNVMFIYRVYVSITLWSTWSAALQLIAGVGLEMEDVSITGREYIEMLPMSVHASIDFNAINGTLGFMFKQNGAFTPSVTDAPGTVQSDALDAARVNYYGVTQTAGRKIAFYQRGVLCGSATAPVDSTVFANEQWFKDSLGADLMNLQLSVGEIPANAQGQAMCDNVVQGQPAVNGNQASGIEAALRNGTISANSSLTLAQQIYITQQTGDSTAWHQVQNAGYWKGSSITSAVAPSGVNEFTYNYTVIYRKNDVVKTIKGSHQLI